MDKEWAAYVARCQEQGRDPWGRDAGGASAAAYNGGITRMAKPNIEAVDSNLTALEKLARQVEDELIELHQRERDLAAARSVPGTDEASLRARYGRHIG